jgi:hypothetical protein
MIKILLHCGVVLFLIIALNGFAQEKPEEAELPQFIKSDSCIGEVTFPHELHASDIGIECNKCHHETNAAALEFPHTDYFDDYWIDCTICHHKSGEIVSESQSCSNCHHSHPEGIADETLSAKVVIHKNCWTCHDGARGKEASSNCKFCHSGPRSKCWKEEL